MSPLPFPAAPDTADAVLEALSREHLLLLLEADGAIRDCNRLADRALAAPGERCVGRSLRALLVTPEAPDRAGLWDALATARGWHGAVTVMSGDGTPLWIALTLSPRREGGHVGLGRLLPGEPERPTGAGGSGRSEAAAVAVAGPQDELLRNLVGVLVHELRTPIGGLTIGLDVVTRRLAKVGEERGFGEQYRGLLGRISEVLDELVQFVRPRSL
ncbi:MAG TPA: PAS domain-containing protein, partial [Myxococcota bacterium]|nr:PAS domain-containing protein [Myxococcota bacterium]